LLADYFVAFHASRNKADAGLAYARSFSPVVEIVDRCLAPRKRGAAPYSGEIGYTYHFDATKCAEFLKELATGRGVHHILDEVDAVNLDERGFVKSLSLRERGEHEVELVIDCTGFRGSILQQALGEPFEPYGDYLLNDRAAVMQLEHQDANYIEPATRASALSAGWNFRIPLATRIGTGYVFSSNFISDEQAIEELLALYGDQAKGKTPRIIPIRTGRVRNAWVKNCVALGLAGGFIEPLEATAIFMTDLGLRWLHHYLPSRDFEPALAAAFNKQTRAVYGEVRDLVQLHYHLNNRIDTPYWRAAREEVKLSDRLADNLKSWRHTTPQPFELESAFLFSSDVYALLLIAKGFYKDASLNKAHFLDAGAYEKFRAAVSKARPGQLDGLIKHGAYLKAVAEAQ
jgi:tryptophan halogenase